MSQREIVSLYIKIFHILVYQTISSYILPFHIILQTILFLIIMNTKRGNQVVVTNMDNKLSEEQKALSSVISDPTTKLPVEAASCLICWTT